MSKVLLFADPHFCSYSSIVRKRGDRFSYRLENQLATMHWLREVSEKYACSAIFCLGDFFDKAQLNSEEITAASEIEFGSTPVYFIVGNHEMGAADLKYSSCHVFEQDYNFEVLNSPAIIGIDSTLFYILPYDLSAHEHESVLELFPDIHENKKKVLLTHNDLKGMTLGKFVTEAGLDLGQLQTDFDLVVNGHLHNQSWPCARVFNLGNVTGQNFSEDAFRYKHQCMILDTDTLEYLLITNPYALNFYKLDFTANTDRAHMMKALSTVRNAVLTIKVYDSDLEYVRSVVSEDTNDQIVCCRYVVEKSVTHVDVTIDVQELHLDHHAAFRNYVLENFEHNDILKTELEEVLK